VGFICSEVLSSVFGILLPATDVAPPTASRPGSSSPPYVSLALTRPSRTRDRLDRFGGRRSSVVFSLVGRCLTLRIARGVIFALCCRLALQHISAHTLEQY
jgi:hypothetical protein